jgi:hypothetical protein
VWTKYDISVVILGVHGKGNGTTKPIGGPPTNKTAAIMLTLTERLLDNGYTLDGQLFQFSRSDLFSENEVPVVLVNRKMSLHL